MSNYGPKHLKLYNSTDNLRRKGRNSTEVSIEGGPNVNSKSYSSKIAQLSAKESAMADIKKYSKLNRKQPVKKVSLSEEEKKEILRRFKSAS